MSPARPPQRLLVADDHPASRAGVRLALEGHGFEIVAEVATARAAVDAAVRERPDLCLLECHLPGNGITAARQISARVPSTAIVMLSVSDRQADVLAAIRAGALGYLLKTVDPTRLPHALRASSTERRRFRGDSRRPSSTSSARSAAARAGRP